MSELMTVVMRALLFNVSNDSQMDDCDSNMIKFTVINLMLSCFISN
jgi:hypothetical protein